MVSTEQMCIDLSVRCLWAVQHNCVCVCVFYFLTSSSVMEAMYLILFWWKMLQTPPASSRINRSEKCHCGPETKFINARRGKR